MPLYVVMTNLPGPGAQALVREVLEETVPVRPEDRVANRVIEAAAGASEFVELEDEHGRGVGPASGVDWQTKSSFDGPTYALLGPFVAEREHRALAGALTGLLMAIDALEAFKAEPPLAFSTNDVEALEDAVHAAVEMAREALR